MSTSPVMSVTDELVAELESECRLGADQHGGMGNDYDSSLFDRIGDTLLALLAERAELLRDRERLNWLSEQGDDTQWMNILRIEMDDYETLRDAVDEIMRQEG